MKTMTDLSTRSLLPTTTELTQVTTFLPGFLDSLNKDEKILVMCVTASIMVLICIGIGGIVCICSGTGRRRGDPKRLEEFYYSARYNDGYWHSRQAIDHGGRDNPDKNIDEEKGNRPPFMISFTDGYLPRTYLSTSSAPDSRSSYSRRYKRNHRSSDVIRKRRRRRLQQQDRRSPRKSRSSRESDRDRWRERSRYGYYGEPTMTIHTNPYDWQ